MSVAYTWGSTPDDRALAFPCDRHLPDADESMYRAVDVEAPSSVLFRWLCQLRAAPYSYDWIDNRGRESPRRLTPGLDDLALGQSVMSIFALAEFEPSRHLTLRLRHAGALFGDVACTYLVVPRSAEASRLVVKLLWHYPGGPLVRSIARALLPWADLVMMRKQLLTLRWLAERDRTLSLDAR
jgi:hypothetical protein